MFHNFIRLLFTISFVYQMACSYAQVESATLDLNGISATINASGLLFHDPSSNDSGFEYPKGSGKHLVFSMSDWYAGIDNLSDLRMAASEGQLFLPHENGDFSPGPLQVSPATGWPPLEPYGQATTNSSAMQEYNHVWVVRKSEIDSFLIWVNSAIPPNWPGYTVPNSILEWPAHGDVTDQFPYYLAPYVDVDSDGTYDPLLSGDYPDIKGDFGAFTIYNDNGGTHQVSGTSSLGLEIHQLVYGFSPDPSCSNYDALNATLFIDRRIINRSITTYTDFSMGVFIDPEIGNGGDDFVGCDVNRSMIYAYNGDSVDEGSNGYGANIPTVGVILLEGIYQNPTGVDDSVGIGINQSVNGFGYENGISDDEKLGITSFTPLDGPLTSVNTASDRFNLLNGIQTDGFPFLDPEGETKFVYPDDSNPYGYQQAGDIYSPWNEANNGNTPGGRRVIVSSGSCTLSPGQFHNVKLAIVVGPNSSGGMNSIGDLQSRVDTIRTIHNLNLGPCDELSLNEIHPQSVVVFPNPTKDFLRINGISNTAEITIYDALGFAIKKVKTDGELNIQDLPTGLFSLVIQEGNHIRIARFIKN